MYVNTCLCVLGREKREEDKSSLNNIVDNTVAMEVT